MNFIEIDFLFFNIAFYDILLLIFIIFLLFISAIISGSEVAFFSLTTKKIDKIKDQYPLLYNGIKKLLNNKNKLLSVLLIMNNFLNIAIILLLSYLNQKIKFSDFLIFNFYIKAKTFKVIFNLLFTTFLILFFGEILPKIYAKINPIRFIIFSFSLIKISEWIFNPFSNILLFLSNFIDVNFNKKESISMDDLSRVISLVSKDSNTTLEDHKILKGIIEFGNTFVKQIMTPRVDMFSISYKTDFLNLLKLVITNSFSRVPIYQDNIDNIIGVIYAKDLLSYLDKKKINWHFLIQDVYFVPENKKLDDLLIEFQKIKQHIAIVVDEYGGVSGLISLEDVIEEIVGDISDEFDDDKLTYNQLDKSVFLFDGKISLKDFYRVLNLESSFFHTYKGDADTLAGFIIEISKDFPRKNQIIFFKNFKFQIKKLDSRRLKIIKVTIL